MEDYMFSVTEKAYAKINLYLDIIKKREDGFHDILTIMQLVSLYDEVKIYLTNTKEISVTMVNSDVIIPQEENIAYLAAKRFYENLDFAPSGGADIYIKKNIPLAAGLAGGSADAAAVLRGLNFLYGSPFSIKELCKIGLEIGSDVPFCIVGGTQVCKNRGEVSSCSNGIQDHFLLIACAGQKESTAMQYRKLDEKYNDFNEYECCKNYEDLCGAFSVRSTTKALALMFNIFEDLYENDENVRKIKQIMYEYEANKAIISGSGPAVLGIFSSINYAEDANEKFKKLGIRSFVCSPMDKEYEVMNHFTEKGRGHV